MSTIQPVYNISNQLLIIFWLNSVKFIAILLNKMRLSIPMQCGWFCDHDKRWYWERHNIIKCSWMLSPMIFPNKWNCAGDKGEKLMILTITWEKQLCIANHFLRAALLKEKQKDLLIMSDVLSCLKIKRCSLLIGSKDIC